MPTNNEYSRADYKLIYAGMAANIIRAWNINGYKIISLTDSGKFTMEPEENAVETYQIRAGEPNLMLQDRIAERINELVISTGNEPEKVAGQLTNFEI
jgi:hypothetical protein